MLVVNKFDGIIERGEKKSFKNFSKGGEKRDGAVTRTLEFKLGIPPIRIKRIFNFFYKKLLNLSEGKRTLKEMLHI